MLADEIRKGHERGWSFTPLSGKKPIQKGWQRAERASLAESLEYATRGNVGMRTGFASMIIVVDDDTAGDHDLNLPATWTVETGGRTPDGRPRLQHYYRARGFVKNSAGTLAKGVDVRGAGGQVVFVGSRHEDTGELYRWAEGASPEDLPLADFPVEIFELVGDADIAVTAYVGLEAWDRGIAAWRKGEFEGARLAFMEFREAHPEDRASQLYLERLDALVTAPPGWDGVFTHTEK